VRHSVNLTILRTHLGALAWPGHLANFAICPLHALAVDDSVDPVMDPVRKLRTSKSPRSKPAYAMAVHERCQ
jgi:hypothetical protein